MTERLGLASVQPLDFAGIIPLRGCRLGTAIVRRESRVGCGHFGSNGYRAALLRFDDVKATVVVPANGDAEVGAERLADPVARDDARARACSLMPAGWIRRPSPQICEYVCRCRQSFS